MSASNESPQSAYQSSFSLRSSTTSMDKDDPRKIQDRKEKKRIQNREAQRIYRSRTKARLEELEARLTSEDAARLYLRPALSDAESGFTAIASPPDYVRTEAGTTPMSAVSLLNEQTRTTDENTDNCNNQIAYEDTFPTSFDAPRGNLTDRSKEFLKRMLSSQSDLLDQLHRFQQEIDKGGISNQPEIENTNLTNSNWADLRHIEPTINTEGSLLLVTQQDFEPWTQDSSTLQAGVESNTITPQSLASNVLSVGPNPSTLEVDQHDFNHGTTEHHSPSEKFESILNHVSQLGFKHFDEVVVSYYTHAFDEASYVTNEQRSSRTRHLPGVLAQIFDASASWTTWERRGVCEEIIKTVESLLLLETSTPKPGLDEKLVQLIELSTQYQPLSAITSKAANIRDEIENSMPYLWTVVMALTQSNDGVKPNDRSKVAMATILLLQYAGRIRKLQLLSLLGTFLV